MACLCNYRQQWHPSAPKPGMHELPEERRYYCKTRFLGRLSHDKNKEYKSSDDNNPGLYPGLSCFVRADKKRFHNQIYIVGSARKGKFYDRPRFVSFRGDHLVHRKVPFGKLNNQASPLSTVIYFELFNADKKPFIREKFGLTSGIGKWQPSNPGRTAFRYLFPESIYTIPEKLSL